ncbi:hypothetical protein K4G61_g366 [Candida parapsilosis]|nr:hypothetical protein K4G61_g366 [Candida parapsilosis]
MLETSTRSSNTMVTSPSHHSPAPTNKVGTRRKSSIVITPSQILCGTFDGHSRLTNSFGTGATTPSSEEKGHDPLKDPNRKNLDLEELPPFSFSKKPIDDRRCCEGEIKSNITTVIGGNTSRTQSRSITPRQSQISLLCQPQQQQQQQPEIILPDDYDERIRFPQMSSHYIYENKPEANRSESFETVVQSQEKYSINENAPNEDVEYTPAVFDINQPTRRYSTPNQIVSKNDETKLLEEFTRNNCIYEVKQDQFFTHQICSENENSTSQCEERNCPRLKNQPSFPKVHHRKDSNQKLNQVYQMKKPMMTPAVLRVEPQKQHHQVQLQSQQQQQALYVKQHRATSSTYTVFTINEHNINISNEPTHKHWQSNSATDACMACLRPFHSPLVTMIYDVPRRHHCRFCGLVFCKSCLDIGSGSDECSMSSSSSSFTPTSISFSSTTTASSITPVAKSERGSNPVMTPIIDKNANFVVPIASATATASGIFSSAHTTKTCHKCTALYETLVIEISKPANIASLLNKVDTESTKIDSCVAVVENPYLNDAKLFDYEITTHAFKRLSIRSVTKRGDARRSNGGVEVDDLGAQPDDDDDERKMSVVGEMPTDWTWSSF